MASEFSILIEDDANDDNRNSNQPTTYRVAPQEIKKESKTKRYSMRKILFTACRPEIVVFLLFVLIIVISVFAVNQKSLYWHLDHKINQLGKDLESTKPFIVNERIDYGHGQIACSEIFESDSDDIYRSK